MGLDGNIRWTAFVQEPTSGESGIYVSAQCLQLNLQVISFDLFTVCSVTSGFSCLSDFALASLWEYDFGFDSPSVTIN